MQIIHSFPESLKESEKWTQWEGWKEIYQEAFPTMISMEAVKKDGWAQRGGIDRLIILASGKTIGIDEKVRPKGNYKDICLEYYSDTHRKTPGWMAKDLACDYIAYLLFEAKQCYLLPFHQLRAAWKKYRNIWVSKYDKIRSFNEGFTTTSVAVPTDILLAALSETTLIKVG